ncbi:hypothetical protein Cgig2_030504 [Carnegiea gigantea]|uniref:Plant heme peroxidase family profile domain-containing protein n=1 Tax=Carnegiea gigantea TaxID=171969 RepID=A0A9Q1JVZ0_9CARY|nr:hypothetical protein Cgig2_030504 [Carnegiea gigantea]
MTIAGGEATVLCCNCNYFSFSSSPPIKLKFPTKSVLVTVQFGAKTPRFRASAFATPPINDNSGASDIPISEYVKDFEVQGVKLRAPEYLLIKDEMKKVLTKGEAAGVLRLVFHDAGTFDSSENSGGMNGSIILEKAKNVVDEKHSVSWADIIAVAGAEAVSICGGPEIPIRLGRVDSLTPDPEGRMPEESLDAPRLKESFQRKGFSTQELIALTGAHTIGSKGFGSPTVFDNSYYKILLEKPWMSSGGMSSMIGLPSDRALVEDEECLRWITKYANDQDLFFKHFKNAYIKLRVHLEPWELVTKPRSGGGLGLYAMHALNAAQLMKVGWHLAAGPADLSARVLRFKYCQGRVLHPPNKTLNTGASKGWQGS